MFKMKNVFSMLVWNNAFTDRVSLLTDSGVATYTELFNCWLRASTRVKVSYGAGHIETIVSKLPLSPNDAAVLQQAYPHGWDTANVFGNIFFYLLVSKYS